MVANGKTNVCEYFGVATRRNLLFKSSISLVLLFWIGFLTAEKIDLTNSDLGRHLKNGEIIWNEGLKIGQAGTVLNSNFYSYTHPEYPFVNHHWAAGVIFFLAHKLAGFSGLSLLYIFLTLATFAIFFHIARRESDFTTTAVLSFFLAPLIAERREIRPEIFSAFFAGVFFLVLWLWSKEKMSRRWLAVLPLVMIVWVNVHIYFFLGFFLIGAFLVSEVGGAVFSRLDDNEFAKKIRKIKSLLLVLILTALASLANPFGLKGALHPLNVYKNYGYTVAEEKSVWFAENYGLVNPNYLLIKAVLVPLILTFILLFALNRKKISVPYLTFAFFFGVLGWMQIRNFTLLGFFALPILAFNFQNIFTPDRRDNPPAKESGLAAVYILVCVFAIFVNFQFFFLRRDNRGIGTLSGNETAANFLKDEKISGPVFNNYDIGGYLIYNLYPEQKVFTDNRPEVYPDSFFSEIYKPMQESPTIFEKVDREYNFNAVTFTRVDITPWGINFQKTIKENPDWAKVFEDDFVVIYLKRNGVNKDLISKYKI